MKTGTLTRGYLQGIWNSLQLRCSKSGPETYMGWYEVSRFRVEMYKYIHIYIYVCRFIHVLIQLLHIYIYTVTCKYVHI